MDALFINNASLGISRRASVILSREDAVMRRRCANNSSTASTGVFMIVLVTLAILAQPIAAQTSAIDPNSVSIGVRGVLHPKNLSDMTFKLTMAEIHGVMARKPSV